LEIKLQRQEELVVWKVLF